MGIDCQGDETFLLPLTPATGEGIVRTARAVGLQP